MNKIINYKAGDTITLLDADTELYIHTGALPQAEPYRHMRNGREVSVEHGVYEFDKDEDVVINEQSLIVDDEQMVYPNIVGGRPANIFKK